MELDPDLTTHLLGLGSPHQYYAHVRLLGKDENGV